MDQQFQHQQAKDEPRSVKKENSYQFFSAAIALCMIAFFTIVMVPSAAAAPKPTSVTIDAEFDFTSSDGVGGVLGTFTTVGALTISGDATMDFPLAIGHVFHCVIVLTAIDEITGTVIGTITIHQECQFGTSPAKGRWQIVSGTDDYANLEGNGSLTMPGDFNPIGHELMTGFIY